MAVRNFRLTAAIDLPVTLCRGLILNPCFEMSRKADLNQVMVAHLKVIRSSCIRTNASDILWYMAVTKVHGEELQLLRIIQLQESLKFLSGFIYNAVIKWFLLEEEAHTAVTTVEKMPRILVINVGGYLSQTIEEFLFCLLSRPYLRPFEDGSGKFTWMDCVPFIVQLN